MIENEFQTNYLGLNPSLGRNKILPMAEIPRDFATPSEFDWRDHNVVTPVKNQVLIYNYLICSLNEL